MNFNELHVNGRTYDVKCDLLNFLHLPEFGMCQKCAGKNTRRHHRKCALRGNGHKCRERSARNAEAACLEYGFFVHVRRGRHGKGVSMNVAGDALLRALARLNALC